MKRVRNAVVLTTLVLLASPLLSQESPMSFFVTSRGPGDGGNLGGLEGADAHCQMLAAEVGRGSATWRAYLSQSPGFRGPAAVNARDRIGAGPWYNANGVMIAANVADLHGDDQRDRNNIRKPTALTEQGDEVKGSGDQPNEHDILTGSDSHGRVVGPVGGGPAPRATTGRATVTVRRLSATTTGWVAPTRPGTRCTSVAVAARRTWWGPVGPDCSTVSRSTDAGHARRRSHR